MRFLYKYNYVLLLLLVLVLSSPAKAKFHVFVVNHIGAEADHIKLTLQCRSSDEDLGTHVVEFGDAFDWEFGGETLYYCDMSWGNNVHGHFDVFDPKRDSAGCGDNQACYWRVDRDGLYLYNQQTDDYELQYRWS